MEGHGAADNFGDQSFDANSLLGRMNREADGYESRSGSDNNVFEGNGSGDDQPDAADEQQRRKKKKYHRHTQFQITELEKAYKECPHPDEKQRLELSRKLGLESRQIKFWFQNRRTQMKTQLERHDNVMMRQENEKLKAENEMLRQGLSDPLCHSCGGPVVPGPISFEQQQLRIENARLKDELGRVCALVNKFLGMSLPSSAVVAAPYAASNGYGPVANVDPASLPMGIDFTDPCIAGVLPLMRQPPLNDGVSSQDKSMLVDFALASMNELINMVETDEPLWVKSPDHLGVDREVLNLDEYARIAVPTLGLKRSGFITEASRETGIVMVNSFALVEMLMDAPRWVETFNGLVARSAVIEVISYGSVNGSKDGTLQLMQAELQVISPLAPARQAKFLRFCKQRAEGVWVVVDVSIGASHEGSSSYSLPTSMRLPSGCLIQDMPNGCSKVTWVEHTEYDETSIHRMLRPVISSNAGFGAGRWLSTLQRYCECLNILLSSSTMPDDPSLMTMVGKKSVVRLANRMVANFCSGVASGDGVGEHKWERMRANDVSLEVKILARRSLNEPGEPSGVVLAASTSVWLPVTKERLFNFLSDDRTRKDWDILSNGGLMQEVVRIPKAAETVCNCISLLRSVNDDPRTMSEAANQIVVLQETWNDAHGSLLVYAPVDVPSMELVMNGGDSAFVSLLPCGFAVFPDGRDPKNNPIGLATVEGGGSVLTIGFQILVNSLPGNKLTVESVDTVNNLISVILQRIKEPLQVMM